MRLIALGSVLLGPLLRERGVHIVLPVFHFVDYRSDCRELVVGWGTHSLGTRKKRSIG